jgi:hypothetical protein
LYTTSEIICKPVFPHFFPFVGWESIAINLPDRSDNDIKVGMGPVFAANAFLSGG